MVGLGDVRELSSLLRLDPDLQLSVARGAGPEDRMLHFAIQRLAQIQLDSKTPRGADQLSQTGCAPHLR